MPRPGVRTRPLLRAPSRDLDSAASLRLTRLSAGLVLIRVSPTDDDDQHHDPFAGTTLTRAERIVVHLVLGGLSNVEVAKVRGSSPRTIANQLTLAYAKLGVGGRRELIARFRPRPAKHARSPVAS